MNPFRQRTLGRLYLQIQSVRVMKPTDNDARFNDGAALIRPRMNVADLHPHHVGKYGHSRLGKLMYTIYGEHGVKPFVSLSPPSLNH